MARKNQKLINFHGSDIATLTAGMIELGEIAVAHGAKVALAVKDNNGVLHYFADSANTHSAIVTLSANTVGAVKELSAATVAAINEEASARTEAIESLSAALYTEIIDNEKVAAAGIAKNHDDILELSAYTVGAISSAITEVKEDIKKLSGATVAEIKAVSATTFNDIKKLSGATVADIKALSGATVAEIKTVSGITASEIKAVSATTFNDIKTLSGAAHTTIAALSAGTMAADKELNDLIESVSGQTVKGIGIKKDGATTYLKLYSDTGNTKEVASVDASAFVVDGMLSAVTYDSSAHTITFTWNTDSKKTPITIDLDNVMQPVIADNKTITATTEDGKLKFSAVMDQTNGVASFAALNAVSAATKDLVKETVESLDSLAKVDNTGVKVEVAITDGKLSGVTVDASELVEEASAATVALENRVEAISASIVTEIIKNEKVTAAALKENKDNIAALSGASSEAIKALSAATVADIKALSGATVAEIKTVSGITASEIKAVSATTFADIKALSGATVAEIKAVSATTYTDIKNLSAATHNTIAALSAGTIAEIAAEVSARTEAVESLSAAMCDELIKTEKVLAAGIKKNSDDMVRDVNFTSNANYTQVTKSGKDADGKISFEQILNIATNMDNVTSATTALADAAAVKKALDAAEAGSIKGVEIENLSGVTGTYEKDTDGYVHIDFDNMIIDCGSWD